MRSFKLKKASRGVGMVELMIGVTISSLLTIAVVTVYFSQNIMFKTQSSRNYAASDAWDVYGLVGSMIRHAQINSFTINYASGGVNGDDPPEIEFLNGSGAVADDEISIVFSVPTGMSIWPNSQAPYDKNVMRLTWKNYGSDKYQVLIELDDGSGFETPILLAGGDAGGNTRIINFDLWPLNADGARQANVTDAPAGGYQMTISTRSSMSAGESDPVFTVSGVIVPRNS